MNEMQEALAAIDGQIQVASPKFPEGATIVGIKLDRDEARAGKYVEAIGRDWIATGMAVAIRGGHVLAANNIFGRWTNGMPKVSAVHFVKCANCGKRVLMPLAVWEAKDDARRKGIDIPREANGLAVLKKYGKCSCGGSYRIDDAGEKAELTAFTDEILKAMEGMETVPALLVPTAFTVGGKAADVPAEWGWLREALAAAGKTVAPFKKDQDGDTIIYNPGLWLGYVTGDHNVTNLFWVEEGRTKGRSHSAPTFNPGEINGL